MMTKNTSLKVLIAKGTIIFSLFAAAVLVFSTRTIAQVKDTAKTKRFPSKEMEASKQDAPTDIVTQFQAIVAKYQLDTVKNRRDFRLSMAPSDREQLEMLYKKMSRKQQQQQVIGFMPHFPPSPRNVPTTTQFEGFKNSRVYGVWINSKKVANTTLNKYKASDFAQFNVSKLYGAAKTGRIYSYQVNMMTNDNYQKYYDEAMERKDKSMMYLLWWSKDGKMENHYVVSSQ